MVLPTITGLALWMCSFLGCAWIGHNRLADFRAEGRIENNVYTSPRQSFRLRLPWLSPNASLRDERPTPNTLLVTIEDDLCREFRVAKEPGSLGAASLQSWVETHVVEDLKRQGFNVRSKPLSTRNGTAIALRYRTPAAAPCRPEADGTVVATTLDADIGWYIYHRDGVFYRLIYIIGIGPGAPSLWYINREPVDDVLAQFADGFELLEVKIQRGPAD